MWILFTLIITTISQPNPSSGTPSEQVIRNYWEHIQGLLKQSDTLRDEEIKNPSKRQRFSSKKYPFDFFGELNTKGLIRACREGIKSAKEEGLTKKWNKQEIDLKCEENIAYALEYYGIVIDKPSETTYLLHCIGNEQEEPELRLFLLKNCLLENQKKSLFTLHFNSLLENQQDDLQKTLITVVKRVNEKPEIQKAGIDALYFFFKSRYKRVLEKDPVYQAYAIENKQEINPLWLDNPQIPKPIESTQIEVGKLNTQMSEFIAQLEIKLQDKRVPDRSIAEKAKETLEKIYNNFPVTNKERLKALIADKE